MVDETEPEKRFGHVAVRSGCHVLVCGGAWYNGGRDLEPLPWNVIWMYNLCTEQWRKHVMPERRKAPGVILGARAVMIESAMYLFGGYQEVSNKSSTNVLWELNRTSDGCFVWSEIVTPDNRRAPSPRHNHTAW